MADEKWSQIHGGRITYSAPTPRLSVPVVSRPTCENSCSGRHETEGIVQCPNCKVPAYRIVTHEWSHQEGHWFYTLDPLNGMKPSDGMTPICDCGRRMVRV